MKVFPDDNFLLNNAQAEALYHDIALNLPIMDYHCRMSAEDIYIRRIFCNLIGSDMEPGLLPDDNELISGFIKNVCYENAKSYFGFTIKRQVI